MEPDSPEKVMRQKYVLFSNQTSGHSCIIKATNGFAQLLKPLDPNEQNFYETTNNRQATAFLAFLPKYYGIHWPTPQEIKYFSKLAKRLIDGEDNPDSAKLRKKDKNHKSFLQKLYSERFSPKAYIKMEDLTLGMKMPRILDLKMGFTPYNPRKLESQSKKYLGSTCGTEGFRFAGFKSYLKTKDEVVFRDKYWGLKIKQTELLKAFALFFYDGESLLKSIIQKFIKKLDLMIESLNEVRGYRFYSCSVLLIYDDEAPNQEYEAVNVKVIDFANTVYLPEKKDEVDPELEQGLKNLLSYLRVLEERSEGFVVDLFI